jgi:hypothetical protein
LGLTWHEGVLLHLSYLNRILILIVLRILLRNLPSIASIGSSSSFIQLNIV